MRLVLSVYITVTVNTGHSWTIMQTMIAFSFLTVVPQGFIIILYFLSFLFVWFSVCLLWIRPQTLHHVSKSSLRHSDAQTFHWFQPSERASSPGASDSSPGHWLLPTHCPGPLPGTQLSLRDLPSPPSRCSPLLLLGFGPFRLSLVFLFLYFSMSVKHILQWLTKRDWKHFHSVHLLHW